MNEKSYSQKDNDYYSIRAYQLLIFRTGNEQKQIEWMALFLKYGHIYITITFTSLIILICFYLPNPISILIILILSSIQVQLIIKNISDFHHTPSQDLFNK